MSLLWRVAVISAVAAIVALAMAVHVAREEEQACEAEVAVGKLMPHVASNAVLREDLKILSTYAESCFAPPVGLEPTTDRLETNRDQQ
jgi:hypothetical protein